MGTNFTPQPPVPDVPDIQLPSFADIAKQVIPTMKDAGWFDQLIASFSTHVMPTVTNYLKVEFSGIDDLLSLGVNALSAMQATNTPGFFTFLAAMLQDLLAVPVDAGTMQAAFARGGQVTAMKAVGASLFDVLAGEFNQSGQVTPQSGIDGCKAFLGFLLSFSVRQANIATITSIIPEEWRVLDGIREYSVALAQNIGLGRLARRALQPLIQVLIAKPMTQYLNNQYRPTEPSEALAMRTFLRGAITQDVLSQAMGLLGWTDAWQAAILDDSYERPGVSEIYTLNKYGVIDQPTALVHLKNRGTSGELANLAYTAEQEKEADLEISAMLAEIRQQRVNGFIDAPTFGGIVDSLPIGPLRKQWVKTLVGQQVEFPRAKLGFADLERAYVDGVIDLTQLQDGITRIGYSTDDQTVLVDLVLIKLVADQYKADKAQWTYEKAKRAALKKGLPPPPAPPGIAV